MAMFEGRDNLGNFLRVTAMLAVASLPLLDGGCRSTSPSDTPNSPAPASSPLPSELRHPKEDYIKAVNEARANMANPPFAAFNESSSKVEAVKYDSGKVISGSNAKGWYAHVTNENGDIAIVSTGNPTPNNKDLRPVTLEAIAVKFGDGFYKIYSVKASDGTFGTQRWGKIDTVPDSKKLVSSSSPDVNKPANTVNSAK